MAHEIVIIHGSFGSSRENWFPWLAQQLRRQKHRVLVPDFPTPKGQSLKSWLDVFDHTVGGLTKGTILVGHSLGAAFILRLLERSRQPISGTYLVSAFLGELGLPDFDAVNSDFVLAPVDWATVKRNAGSVNVFHSDSDPYVPLARGEYIAKHLEAHLTVLHNAGHINAAAGYLEFPQILKSIEAVTR